MAVGIDPGQLLFETAVRTFGVYLQFAALALLVIAVYLSYSSLIEAIRMSKSTYRTVGLLGVVGVLSAFLAGFLIFQLKKAALMLLVAGITWIIARLT